MDKLPRLRRKPKPPAIETSVERTSTDTNESTLSNNAVGGGAGVPVQVTEATSRPTTSHNGSPGSGSKPTDSWGKKSWLQKEQTNASGKKSPFRNLRLRPSASRQDGVKVRSMGLKSRDHLDEKEDVHMVQAQPSDPGPIMPSFLTLERDGAWSSPG
jgi:hypothetical protein